MMYYIVAQLSNAIICSILGLLVFFQNKKQLVNQIFMFYTFATFIWSFSFAKMCMAKNHEEGLFWARALHAGAILVPAFLLHFMLCFLQRDKERKHLIRLAYIIAIIFLVFLPTNFFVSHTVAVVGFEYFVGPAGVQYHLFPVFFVICTGYSFYELIRALKHARGFKKNQIRYLLVSLVIAYSGGVFGFAPLYEIAIPRFAFFSVSIYSLIIAYAIFKHHLMDIDLVWRYLLEKIIYFIFTLFVFMLGWKFIFFEPLNPQIIVILSACVIFIPDLRYLVANQLNVFLLKKYKVVWDKLEQIANSKQNLYSIRDIVSVLVIDIPKLMSLKKSGYYKHNDTTLRYESLFSNDKDDFVNFDDIMVARMKKTQAPIIRDHLRDTEDDKLIKDLMEKRGFSLCYPIFSGDMIMGIVVYGEKRHNQIYHKEELEQLASIIKKAQEQIHNVLHLEYLSNNYAEKALQNYKSTYQMQLLRETRRIGSIRDIDELTEHIIGLVNRSVNAEYTYLYLYDEVKRVYTYQKGSKRSNHDLPVFVKEEQPLMKHLRQTKEIVLIDTLKKWAEDTKFPDIQAAEKLAEKLKATIVVPLIDITLLGFLVVGNKRDQGYFSNDDFFVLSFIADRSEMNISNVLIREKAERDSLTGLHNKGYLLRRTKEEVANCLKFGGSVTYFMVDADDFKWFNDYHSHLDGDEVLVAIVNAIKSCIRPTDEFCRYGGEEFPILISGLTEDEVPIFGNKILGAVRKNEKINAMMRKYKRRISVSIGISIFQAKDVVDEFTNEEIFRISSALIMRSDMALKQAKKNGKDQFQITAPFERGEEGSDIDIFSMKVLLVSMDEHCKELRVSGADIDVLDDFDEALKICEVYDIVLLDMQEENVHVMDNIKNFREKNRDLVVGVFTEYVKYKAEIESFGAKFLPAPLEASVIEEWIVYLKKNYEKIET